MYYARLYPDGSATIANGRGPAPTDLTTLGIFAAALALTFAIELSVAFLYLHITKIKNKVRILITAALANVVSLPIVWFVFVILLGAAGYVLGEIFAVAFEGYAIYYFNKKAMKLKSAMTMSLAMNIASVILGGIVLFLLLLYG
ncbi:Uncharacterised protein [uncultured archaeon]|nr:Uncharacterised protein [uncultured archaeon]